jgi:uncharacterized damage-inducible protein DinB
MTETTSLRTLLQPELEAELATTRRILAVVPDDQPEFKCHEKSMSLAKLAGHVAEMPAFATILLTSPDLDLGAPGGTPPFVHVTSAQTLAAFNEFADGLLTAFKNTSDQTFEQRWNLVYGDYKIFSGTRYNAYRTWGINHLVHHRAQLGVYLRLLGIPVPKTYGPSADEM